MIDGTIGMTTIEATETTPPPTGGAAHRLAQWTLRGECAAGASEAGPPEGPLRQPDARLRTRRSAVVAGVLAALAFPAFASAQTPTRPDFELDALRVSVGTNLDLAQVPRAIDVITAAELQALPVTTVEAALKWATGVDLLERSPAQADVSIRGGTFEQVLVLVDGVRVSDPQTGHFDLDLTIPLEQVERIEVLRGSASSAYGADAFGGVINIVTKAPTHARGTARIEGGSFGGFAGSGSMSMLTDGGIGITASFSQNEADGHRDGTDYSVTKLHSQVRVPTGSGDLVADLGWAGRDFGAGGFYAPFDSYEETRTLRGTVRWEAELSDRFTLTPRVSRRQHDDEFILIRDDPDFYRNVHDSDQTQADLIARFRVSDAVSLAAGGEWAEETVDSNVLGDRDETRTAAFGELGLTAGRVELVTGVRLDDREGFDAFVSPSVAFGLQLADDVQLRASASRAFRTPTWTERYYEDPANIGTPDLEVEEGWSVEAGFDFGLADLLGPGATAGVTLFTRRTENLIDWAKSTGDPDEQWRTRNVEQADFDGLEFTLNQVGVGPLMVSAGGHWLSIETSEDGGFFSKSSLRPLHRRIHLGVDFPSFAGITLGTQLLHRDRTDEESAVSVDLRAATSLLGGELFLNALNIGDSEFLDISGLPEAGASYRIGFRTSW